MQRNEYTFQRKATKCGAVYFVRPYRREIRYFVRSDNGKGVRMNLLDFGMKYEKSRSRLLRKAAQAALRIEMKRADRCERRLEKKEIFFPDDAAQAAALFEQIKARIADEEER